MKVTSYEQVETYEVSRDDLGIYWGEEFHEPEGEEFHEPEGEEAYWTYDYCLVKTNDTYAVMVAKIIRSEYTLDAELAAINSGGEDYYRFLQFRETAKNLARGWLGMEQQPVPRWQFASIIMDRLTEQEREALMSSDTWQVRWLLNKTVANQAISDADPDFALGVMLLDQLNIISEDRWDDLLV
jgi:hypothetical protein